MTLLAEYALSPDVFDETCYASPALCGALLQGLKEVLLHEGLVRDLRNGEWSKLFLATQRPWHLRGKELLKKLATQRRLFACSPAASTSPASDQEWCDEALASHSNRTLNGVIVSDGLATAYRGNRLVAPIGNLAGAAWWASRSSSLRLGKTLPAYQSALELVVRHSNSIMVIDPYFNPVDPRYHAILTVLEGAAGRTPTPLIEIHRVVWWKSDDKRPQSTAIESALRTGLQAAATRSRLSFDVFLWDDFHDRYLISDLVGINVPHGFDTTRAPNVRTTWTRLGRDDRDDVQREFDRASRLHVLKHQFRVS